MLNCVVLEFPSSPGVFLMCLSECFCKCLCVWVFDGVWWCFCLFMCLGRCFGVSVWLCVPVYVWGYPIRYVSSSVWLLKFKCVSAVYHSLNHQVLSGSMKLAIFFFIPYANNQNNPVRTITDVLKWEELVYYVKKNFWNVWGLGNNLDGSCFDINREEFTGAWTMHSD